jgi:DNA gyrase/topoisomerase IV subunit B
MSEEKKYTIESIADLNPMEHMRYRPAMYIGRVDERGNLEIIKALFEFLDAYLTWNTVRFQYLTEDSFEILFDTALDFELSDAFFSDQQHSLSPDNYLFLLLVGLSSTCKIHSNGKELCYEKSKLTSQRIIENRDELRITFSFDTSILRSPRLPAYLLFNFFKRYSFLYPKKEIQVFQNATLVETFCSNGIQDWFAVQSFETELLLPPVQFSIEDASTALQAEIMFSIHRQKEKFSTITIPRVDFITQNGTHATGFKNGLENAIAKIVGDKLQKSIFSEYRNPIGVFKLSYPNILFHGPTREKIGSKELTAIFQQKTEEILLANNVFKKAVLAFYSKKGC